MEDLDNEVDIIRRLLDSVDGLAIAPDIREEVREFAADVKVKYERLKKLLEEKDLQQFRWRIDYAKQIKTNIESFTRQRRCAQGVAIAGNAARIAGTLMESHPMGSILYWSGFIVSSLSDAEAESSGCDAKQQVREFGGLVESHSDDFRDFAKAIRDLDDTIKARIGKSLYDKEFQNILVEADKQPDRAEELAEGAIEGKEEQRNMVALVRDRSVLGILKTAVSYAMKEDMAMLTVLVQALNGLSFMSMTPSQSAALQVGELSLRGVIMVIEHKRTVEALSHFEREIERMEKEYKALSIVP